MLDLEAVQAIPASSDPLYAGQRLSAVERLGLAQASARRDLEPLLADLLEHLAACTGAETVLVNALLGDAVAVVAARGLEGWIAEAGGAPAEWSMCSTTARHAAAYVVEDLAADPEWADTPLVAIDGLRSYAGMPLLTSDGSVVGTVCVIGTAPRSLPDTALEDLALCAGEVLHRLEAHAKAPA